MALRWGGETERDYLLKKKYLFLFSLRTKMFSSLHKIQIEIQIKFNNLWQMDFPGDDFHSFLNLDSVIYFQWDSRISLPVFI